MTALLDCRMECISYRRRGWVPCSNRCTARGDTDTNQNRCGSERHTSWRRHRGCRRRRTAVRPLRTLYDGRDTGAGLCSHAGGTGRVRTEYIHDPHAETLAQSASSSGSMPTAMQSATHDSRTAGNSASQRARSAPWWYTWRTSRPPRTSVAVHVPSASLRRSRVCGARRRTNSSVQSRSSRPAPAGSARVTLPWSTDGHGGGTQTLTIDRAVHVAARRRRPALASSVRPSVRPCRTGDSAVRGKEAPGRWGVPCSALSVCLSVRARGRADGRALPVYASQADVYGSQP